MKNSITILFVLLSYIGFGQDYTDKWHASFSTTGGLEIANVAQSSTGDIYILGTIFNGGAHDARLRKYNKDGIYQWEVTYSSSYGDSEDYAVEVLVDSDDNVFTLVNINPEYQKNTSVPNGYIIQKYNASGTLVSEYENVNDATVKLGPKAYDMHLENIIGGQPDFLYLATSRAATGGMGLEARLTRYDNFLAFEASSKYDSEFDDVPEVLYNQTLIIRQNANLVFQSWDPSFETSDAPESSNTQNIGSTIEEILDASGYVMLKLANGTYHFQRINGATSFTYGSTYSLNDVSSSDGHVFITGSKTVSDHEEMVLISHNSSTGTLEFEKLLDADHGSANSSGAEIIFDGTHNVIVAGNMVQDGIQYPGTVTFDNEEFEQTDVSFYTSQTTSSITHALVAANREKVLIGNSGSTTYMYSLCAGALAVTLGDDLEPTVGSTATLGLDLPAYSSVNETYEWSTGETTRTIEVTESGTYGLTVYNEEGCPGYDEVNVTFLAPAPDAATWLHPTIEVSDGSNTELRLNWSNDDPDAVEYDVEINFYELGPEFTGTTSTTDKFRSVVVGMNATSHRVISKNADDVGSSTGYLFFRSCNDYNMSALQTYMNGLTLSGAGELSQSGGSATYSLQGFSGGDEELKSFFEWTLPSGWKITEYRVENVTVDVPENATSGQVKVRIVNPCTGEATSYLTRDVVIKQDQTINFPEPDATQVGATPFDLGATASSGLDVTYTTSVGGIVEIENGIVTPIGAGSVNIFANQEGNSEWNAAPQVQHTLTVSKGDDVITFDALDNVVWNVDDFDLDDLASSKSGRQITWSGTDDEVAMVTSIGAVNPAKPGTITITASLGANDDWNAAINVQQTLTVEKADQTITFSPVPSKLETDDDFQIFDYITVSSGLLPTVVSSQTSVADITGSVLNIMGPGTTTLTASQTGNDYYNPASNKQQSFTVEGVSTLAFSAGYPQFEHFLGSTYRLLLKLTETGSVYYIVEPDGSSEPTPSQIEAGKNASGSDAFKKGVAFDLEAETENNAAQISGLAEGASYDIYLVLADESYDLQANVTKLDVTIEDNTAPEWSEGYPQMGTISSLEADVEIDLNEETGTVYYAVFSSSSTTRFPANLKNGNNFGAIDEGSVSASASGFTLTGLTEDREYDVWLVAEDADENLQSTAYKIDFTTIDDIAPQFVSGFPALTAVDETVVDIEVKINEGGTVYAVAQLSGEMAPTFGQVKVGNNSSGSTAISANSLSVTKNELGELSLTGLTSEVAYDFYVVAEDDHSNSSGTPIKLSATTADLKAPTITPTYLTEVLITSTEATFSFSLDEEGTFYYVLDGSIVTSPSPAQVKAGKTENDEMAQISGSKVVNSIGVDQNITISGLNPGQEYELYYVAEDGIGNIGASTLGNTFRTEKLDQTITFEELPAKVFGDANFNLEATASSGLTVTYSSSDESVAMVLDNTVTIVGAGTTTITAMQSGDDTYNLAEHVLQGLVVSKATQTIDFTTLETKTIGDAAFELVATGGASGNQVTFSSSNENVATVSGNTVTIVGAGVTTITASQAGNANYEAAVDVAQELVVESQVVASVGIDAFVEIYPNPTSDYLTITGRQLVSATLYDLSGSQMKEWAIGDKTTLDLGEVPDGVYLLRLVDHEGASMTHRIKKKN